MSASNRAIWWSHSLVTTRWLQHDQTLPLSAKGVACETSENAGVTRNCTHCISWWMTDNQARHLDCTTKWTRKNLISLWKSTEAEYQPCRHTQTPVWVLPALLPVQEARRSSVVDFPAESARWMQPCSTFDLWPHVVAVEWITDRKTWNPISHAGSTGLKVTVPFWSNNDCTCIRNLSGYFGKKISFSVYMCECTEM